MSRESGEHSLSMLLVLSLWALEFCLSFMEVLRGRLCILFSILLRRECARELKIHDRHSRGPQERDPGVNKTLHVFMNMDNITWLCVHVSRCSDEWFTLETCGFETLSCRACQRCWSSVQCWHPSCSPPPALAHCHLSLAPETKRGGGKVEPNGLEGDSAGVYRTTHWRRQVRSLCFHAWGTCSRHFKDRSWKSGRRAGAEVLRPEIMMWSCSSDIQFELG